MANFIPPVNGASLGSYFYVEILNSALNTIQIWVGQTTAQGQKNAGWKNTGLANIFKGVCGFFLSVKFATSLLTSLTGG